MPALRDRYALEAAAARTPSRSVQLYVQARTAFATLHRAYLSATVGDDETDADAPRIQREPFAADLCVALIADVEALGLDRDDCRRAPFDKLAHWLAIERRAAERRAARPSRASP